MSFAMGKIVWPENGRDANLLLRKFMLEALLAIEFKFAGDLQDPIECLEGYVSGRFSSEHCSELAARWKSELSGEDRVRDFESSIAIQARLADSILGIDESNVDGLADELSWFTEILQSAGVNYRVVREIMIGYFDPYLED